MRNIRSIVSLQYNSKVSPPHVRMDNCGVTGRKTKYIPMPINLTHPCEINILFISDTARSVSHHPLADHVYVELRSRLGTLPTSSSRTTFRLDIRLPWPPDADACLNTDLDRCWRTETDKSLSWTIDFLHVGSLYRRDVKVERVKTKDHC